MNVSFNYNQDKIRLNIGHVNVFYGYSQSGKSTLAKLLESGLLGKEKGFYCSSTIVTKDEKSVIFIDSKESLIDHIKLGSKSYLKKYYYNKVKDYFEENYNILENINESFNEINELLKQLANEFNNNSLNTSIDISLNIDNVDEIIDNFVNVRIRENSLSSSSSKELLILLITMLQDSDKETHIIIDDFDAQLDEETTMHLFNKISDSNAYFYLFTNKPNSLPHSISRFHIYNVRRQHIFDFTNLDYIVKTALAGETKYNNYEEYMLDEGYLVASGELSNIYSKIQYSSVYCLGRMFTSKDFKISNDVNYNKVVIQPSSEDEYKVLSYIASLINLN